MANRSTIFCMLLIFSATSLIISCHAVEYKNISPLKAKCEQSVYLQCPNKQQTSAGTLQHLPLPTETCHVTMKTIGFCGKYGTEYAIYINIRKSKLPEQAMMEIFDLRPDRMLIKSWGSGEQKLDEISASVGHVRSSYARQPELSIEYTHSQAESGPGDGVVLDYILVERQNSSHRVPCYALDGYIHQDYICDDTDQRINCPADYKDAVYSMKAPMGRQEECGLGFQLDTGTIIGIVIACMICVGIIVFAIVAFRLWYIYERTY